MRNLLKRVSILICFLVVSLLCKASHLKNDLRGYENNYVNKFVTIKSQKANARIGPGKQYHIKWVFVKKNEPVEIKAVFENWRQICDVDNQCAWIHVGLLSNKRAVIFTKTQTIHRFPHESSAVIAKVHKNVRCHFANYCNLTWCKVKCEKDKKQITGWSKRINLWGIKREEFPKNNIIVLLFKSIF